MRLFARILVSLLLLASPLWAATNNNEIPVNAWATSLSNVSTTGAGNGFLLVENGFRKAWTNYVWKTSFTGTPTSITYQLRGTNDGGVTWDTIDTSTSTAGESRSVQGKFYDQLRCNISAIVANGATTSCQIKGVETKIFTANTSVINNGEQSNSITAVQQVTQSAAVLIDQSANSGVDTTLSTSYLVSGPYACPASGVIGSIDVRMKATGTITNPTGHIVGQIFADSSGPSGTTIYNGSGGSNAVIYTMFGSLTTTYQRIRLGGNKATCTPGSNYWFGLNTTATPTGADIVIDSKAATGGSYTSNNGSTWSAANIAINFKAYGADYVGVYAFSDTNVPVNGIGIDQVGIQGTSTNNTAGNFYSKNAYGVFAGGGSIGVMGVSYYGIGGQFFSTAGNALSVAQVAQGCPFAGQTGCSVLANIGSSLATFSRTVNAGNFNVTGPMISITDNPTTSGTWAASLIQGTIGSTLRFKVQPKIADSAASVAYVSDTEALTTPGAKIQCWYNNGVEKVCIDKDGVISRNGIATSGTTTLVAGCGGTITSNTTVVLNPLGQVGAVTCGATGTTNQVPIRAATIKNLRARAATGSSTVGSGVVTVFKNGAATTITCTLGNTSPATCSDTAHSVVFADMDTIMVKVQSTQASGDALANIVVSLEAQ